MSLHFIIDGYNLMKQVPYILKKKAFRDREGFIRFIDEERLCGSKNNKITVVFDGREDVFGLSTYSTIEVIFTKRETADEKIKRLIEKSLYKNILVVISDDNEIKYFAKSQGVRVMGAEDFLSKMKNKKNFLVQEEKKISLESSKGIEITRELERIWLKKKEK
ncbi:MAG: NYN domain-containing protein [Candidatus Omnitrophica bacterium]|nr:NYN domain-containing protein [Candidatus Omnitrophota bacterium]